MSKPDRKSERKYQNLEALEKLEAKMSKLREQLEWSTGMRESRALERVKELEHRNAGLTKALNKIQCCTPGQSFEIANKAIKAIKAIKADKEKE